MSFLSVSNISIRGISACVPKDTINNQFDSIFTSEEEAKKFIDTTGIANRHSVLDRDLCTSDLCMEAANQLLANLKWDRSEIDCLIFVTQTPDYILPATSCILQHKLGLPNDCYAMDVSLGCSGWVYGLSVISSLLNSGTMKKGLLLAGDTTTVTKSARDKSTFPLFGDAGTATAVEFSPGSTGIKFNFGTDGKGYDAIIIPDGGFRNFFSPESLFVSEVEEGIFKNRLQSILNGPAVFTFGIVKAPKSIKALLDYFGIDDTVVDYYVFHQANLIMNEKIRNKLKIPSEKVPYSLNEYGNTSSASIPLTICHRLKDQASSEKLTIMACAFGVGLSWASAFFEIENIVCLKIIEI